MPTDILYPLLIALGCGVLALVVHHLTRPEPTRHDFTVPVPSRHRRRRSGRGARIVDRSPVPDAPPPPTRDALLDWHLAHEHDIVALIRRGDVLAAGTTVPPADPDDGAFATHPAPEMRAELAAFEAATNAMADALTREDTAAHARHRAVYLDYRASWLERLWQFPVDRSELADLRRHHLR